MQAKLGGVLTYLAEWGCAALTNGSLFYKKSLNMGTDFYHKILKHGQWRNSYGLRVGKPAGTRAEGAPAGCLSL